MKIGWQTKSVGEILQLEYGKPLDDRDRKPNGRFPVYGANGEKDRTDKFYHDKPSIVVGRKGSAGELNLTETNFWPLDVTYFITFDEQQYDLRFLYHLLTTLELTKLAKGVKPGINRNEVYSLATRVPPLAEQQRIVGVLDEAFACLATAQASAEKNLQNARALFESHLQSVFTQRGEGWVEKHLKEVCEKITDGTHQTPKYFDEGTVFLSSRNVTSGVIDWDRIKYIDTKQHLEMHRRVAPRRDDILLAKNGTTGVAAIVDRDTTFDIYVSLALLRALPVIRPRLLLQFINSPAAKIQFNKRLKGVGVPNLHLEEIREVRVAFPSDLGEQDRVIAGLDDLHTETQRLQTLYQQKLAALDELKKSLLQQAFSGAL